MVFTVALWVMFVMVVFGGVVNFFKMFSHRDVEERVTAGIVVVTQVFISYVFLLQLGVLH